MNERRDDRFHETIDGIEPETGAKERMLENIKRKAAMQVDDEQKSHNPPEKKILPFNKVMKMALPIAACFVIAVIGIVKIVPLLNNTLTRPGDDVQISDPFVTVDSAKDFEKLGIYIDAPEGAIDTSYTILDGEIADITFTVDNHEYTIRASKQSGDFSGIYGDTVASNKIDSETDATLETIRASDEILYKLSWTNGSVHFILFNIDGASAESVTAIYQAIK